VGHAVVGRHYKDRVYPDVRYYECGSLTNRDYQFCRNVRVNADRIERAIWAEIESFMESPSQVIDQLAARYNQQTSADEKRPAKKRQKLVTAKKKNLEARERLVMAIARGVISDADARLGLG
jgi:hypothetical protein